MSNCILKLYIKSFKNQKTEVFPKILGIFKTLINYYAKRLECDDGQQELILFFVELLFSIDTEKFESDSSNSLARYIAVAIRNKYIELSKSYARYQKLNMKLFENRFGLENEIEAQFETNEMLKFLSLKQRRVIICKYFYNYSDAEISELMGISRQAVNNLKNRALETLRQFYL